MNFEVVRFYYTLWGHEFFLYTVRTRGFFFLFPTFFKALWRPRVLFAISHIFYYTIKTNINKTVYQNQSYTPKKSNSINLDQIQSNLNQIRSQINSDQIRSWTISSDHLKSTFKSACSREHKPSLLGHNCLGWSGFFIAPIDEPF